MKILMVASYLPYPLFSGGHIRLYNLMKNLKEDGHKITLVCEKRDYQTPSDIKSVEKVCDKVIAFPRKKQWSPKNIAKAGLSFNSFLTVGHHLPEMEKAIREEIESSNFDLIHIETFYVFQNIPETKIPTVLVEHNIEYLVYKRFADNAPVFAKPFLMLDVKKIKREEEYWWKKATKLVAVSIQEKELMKRQDAVVVANGVDVGKFNIQRKFKTKSQTRKVLFIGDFKWIQNRDAVEWIIKNIWPAVLEKTKEKGIDAKLWIVGKRIPPNLKEMANDSIMFDENAPSETELIYKEADLLLAPIRVGGGTSFKILESMATGLPVLTTELGNEGINGQKDKDLIIDDDPQDFARDVVDLLTDDKRYEEISNNAKEFIKSNFNWKNISLKLEQVYKSAVK